MLGGRPRPRCGMTSGECGAAAGSLGGDHLRLLSSGSGRPTRGAPPPPPSCGGGGVRWRLGQSLRSRGLQLEEPERAEQMTIIKVNIAGPTIRTLS